MVKGEIDGYIQNKGGASKWDTCSGEA